MKNPFSIVTKYFNWLQKDNPTGGVEQFPDLSRNGETSVKGVFIIGDLTGIPLLKFATNSGKDIMDQVILPEHAEKAKSIVGNINENDKSNQGLESFDLVIIGAGPAGIAAAIEAEKKKLNYTLLEGASRPFNTIEDFPKGKGLFYEPDDLEERSGLPLIGQNKEKLLETLHSVFKKYDFNIRFNHKVESIESAGRNQHIIHIKGNKSIHSGATILAIGKSGSHRRLKIEGEDLPHVFYKLFDPSEYQGKKILVVGGGDSAVEASLLLQKSGNDVSLSFRKPELIKPKPGNINAINKLAKEGKVTLYANSNVAEIREKDVDIDIDGQVKTVGYDLVFIFIGTEPPYEFFQKSGIKLANVKTKTTYWWMAFSLAFANIIYFGKMSQKISPAGLTDSISSIFSGGLFDIVPKLVAWLSVFVFVLTGLVVLKDLLRNWTYYFKNRWSYIKYSFFFFVLVLFLVSFFGNKYFDFNLGGKDPYFWYSFLYTVTIGLFGLRRIIVSKKKYVTLQTVSVFLIQALPLFFIPNFILPWMNELGLISPWIAEHVFLGGQWWRFIGFILAWPLFIGNVITDNPSMFWLIVSLIQTFVIIPILVIKFGKGAYCSWICSCGALAETLGDEYRTFSWHGPKAKKAENIGQIILLSIIVVSIMHILGWSPSLSGALEGVNAVLLGGYQIIVDTLLAGTIGVGLYFFYGGRVWCRFFCPLAALMHIYNKFSHWHILSDKKKCISCGLCTKSCHMGIDVMSYAQQGKPLDDVECVNCSACVNVCPTNVLSFGKYKKVWSQKK